MNLEQALKEIERLNEIIKAKDGKYQVYDLSDMNGARKETDIGCTAEKVQ